MITRDNPTIETQALDSSNLPSAWGQAVVIDSTSHKLRAIKSGDSNVTFGFLARPYPQQSANNDFGSAETFTAGQLVGVMRRGYMSVALFSGTAVNGGTVYIRVTNEEDNTDPIGSITATSDSTNTVAVTGATFTGPADSDGNVEIAFNI